MNCKGINLYGFPPLSFLFFAILVSSLKFGDVTDVVLESLDTETRRVTGEIKFTSKEGENAAVEL